MREEILNLAQQQLKEGGYENLSFGRIAQTLETTRANLHYHYKNKESLAKAAVQSFMAEFEEQLSQLLSKHKGDFPGFLAELEAFMLQSVREEGCKGACPCSQVIREASVPQSITKMSQDHFKHVIELFTVAIDDSKASSNIKTELPSGKLAMMTMNTMMGMAQMIHVDESPEFLDSMEGMLSQWILNYT